jgi:hypothetical protein
MTKKTESKFNIRQTVTDQDLTNDVDEFEEESYQPSIAMYSRIVMAKPSNISRTNQTMNARFQSKSL